MDTEPKIDVTEKGFQRLNSVDRAVLAAMFSAETRLFDAHGYPNLQAASEIAVLSGCDERDVYYSLKFLKMHNLLGVFEDEPNEQAIAEFERTPVKSGATFYDLATILGNGGKTGEGMWIEAHPHVSNPVDQLIDQGIAECLNRDGSRTEYSDQDVMYVFEPLFGVMAKLCVLLDHTWSGPLLNQVWGQCEPTFTATLAKARRAFKVPADRRFNYVTVSRARRLILDDIHDLRRRYDGKPTEAEMNAVLAEAPATPTGSDPLLETSSVYPLWVWKGTAYAEFATICTRDNYIPPEFFIEALKTVIGGAAGHLLGVAGSEVEARFYTVLIGEAGTGKSTAINWAREVFAESLVHTYGSPMWPNIGCFVGGFGSQVGLVRKARDHSQILQIYDELSTLSDKFKITGSGLSFLSLLNALYERTLPPSNITKDALPDLEHPLHNSILGATTPDVWERTFGGTGSEGSGFFQRLNVVGSEETRTVPRLIKPDFKQFEPLVVRVKALAEKPYLLPMNESADALLKRWLDGLTKRDDATDTGRLQVLALRNAAHIGWLLNVQLGGSSTIGPEEVIRRAIALSNYQLAMRRKYQPVTGDTPWAQMENLIIKYVKQARAITRKNLYRRVHGNRYGLNVFNSALGNLEREGLIRTQELKEGRHKTQMIYWAGD